MIEYLLTATELGKAYGPTLALDGASFHISAGEVVAVLGPSGSGKSTLLQCLAGIAQADTGQVMYGGRDLTTLSDSERSALRRGDFGFVFQFGQLVPELSCRENVALPLRLNGMARREALARATDWLQRLDVAELADKRPGQVSGGQGQRVAVARALVTEPKVLFADEPTGALDSVNGQRVMQLFTEAARDLNTAIVLVTHARSVAAYADREIEVRDGRTATLERQS